MKSFEEILAGGSTALSDRNASCRFNPTSRERYLHHEVHGLVVELYESGRLEFRGGAWLTASKSQTRYGATMRERVRTYFDVNVYSTNNITPRTFTKPDGSSVPKAHIPKNSLFVVEDGKAYPFAASKAVWDSAGRLMSRKVWELQPPDKPSRVTARHVWEGIGEMMPMFLSVVKPIPAGEPNWYCTKYRNSYSTTSLESAKELLLNNSAGAILEDAIQAVGEAVEAGVNITHTRSKFLDSLALRAFVSHWGNHQTKYWQRDHAFFDALVTTKTERQDFLYIREGEAIE